MTKRSGPAETVAGEEPELRRQIEQLEAEAAAAREEIERLHQDVHRWWSVADQYRHELLAINASISWRITAPLRLVAKLLSGVPIVRLPRRAAKAILVWTIRRVLTAPRLRAIAEMLLSGHPRLRQRLRNQLVAPAYPAETPPPSTGAAVEERLSERAASVYAELRRSLAARER